MKWIDEEQRRATITYHLSTPEPVVVELISMDPTRPEQTEDERNIRTEYTAGTHDFMRDVYVLLFYKQNP